ERTRHNFLPRHRNRLCDHNSESALRVGRQGAGFAEFHSGAKIHRGACVLVHRLSYPLGTKRIFVHSVIGTTRKAPIQNRLFDPVAFGDFRSGAQIPLRERGRRLPISASLDYANRWRGQHMEMAYHGDRKSCSTRLEISTPSCRYGCTNIADIVTPYDLFPPLQ
ncbi:hypothetical protein Taro_026592, partial [Colocasia esculenta]|nr:hypothetical protein [Colocasia esculenta]